MAKEVLAFFLAGSWGGASSKGRRLSLFFNCAFPTETAAEEGLATSLTGCITLDAFYNLCLHNCNLFKLATGCLGKPNRKRRSSNKGKSIFHAAKGSASADNTRPNKRQMVIGIGNDI